MFIPFDSKTPEETEATVIVVVAMVALNVCAATVVLGLLATAI
jgi:hypothetical protein